MAYKRQLYQGFTPSPSPSAKRTRKDLENFIKDNFEYRHMATLGKGDVSDICTAQGFSGELLKHLTHIVKKTFSARGNTVELRGDRSSQVWMHLGCRLPDVLEEPSETVQLQPDSPLQSMPSSPLHTVDTGAAVEPLPESVPSTPSKEFATPRTPRKQKRDIPFDLSADEIIGITQIREGKVSVGVVTLIGKEKFEQLIMDASANMLRKEVAQYSTGKSILSSTHARDLAKFEINKVSDEFQQRLPKTVQTIKSIALRDQEGKQKTHASVSPAVTSVICKCLGIYSERLSAYRYGMSSFLSLGGLKQQSVDQLARLYDAMSTSSRDTKNKQYAEIFDETKQQWKDSDVTFQIGFDNVDKRIGRREQTKLSPGKLHHMVQAVAIRDRVIANPGPPAFPIQSVDPDLLLPTEDDIVSVTEGFADMLRETWADMIPALEWMRPKQYKHQYSEQMKAKSEKINIGVFKKNENIHGDMRDLMGEFQSYVKDTETGDPIPVFLTGDWLSMRVGQRVQRQQADGATPRERYDGLVCVMADFHCQMEVLAMTWKVLLSMESGCDHGTLYCCRNILNATLTSEPRKEYFKNGSLMDKTTKAYAVLGALKLFQLESADSSSPYTKKPDKSDNYESVASEISQNFVCENTYLDLITDGAADYRCNICDKQYENMYGKDGWSEHMIKHHGNSVGTDDDYVLYHTRALMTLGLFRLYHNKLISVGDGKRLMSLYRLMYVWCHNLGLKNYALGLLELQFQLAVLPEHMRVSLIQNRFVNFAGKVDTNHPVDLVVEHENKFFKQNIKTYRGDFTQNALDKVTKASNVTKAMKKNLKQSTGLRQKDVGTHTSKDPRPDVLALVNQFRGDSLFEDIPSRSYKNLFVHPNVFKINRSELLYFVTKNVKTFKTMHYYRYVNTVNLG